MKTITISNEIYSKLVEIAKEYCTQDNMVAPTPYFYQVQHKEIIYFSDVSQGDYIFYYSSDGKSVILDVFQLIEEYQEITESELTKDEIEIFKLMWQYPPDEYYIFRGETKSLNNIMGKHFPDYTRGSYKYNDIYENAFLTKKSCREHIESNKHHYEHPTISLTHAKCNPDMETISELLMSIYNNKNNK
ncbi:MAG: hypothetical protein M0R46_16510 [Candidatus Muirbacterium halophilum]|nr:hypothetical protein [Candidatus Muirbacterium halophilum]